MGPSWGVVVPPGCHAAGHSPGAAWRRPPCRGLPKSGSVFNTLGVAEYRAGNYQDAVATLTRSTQLNTEVAGYPDPADLAFLAMSHLSSWP